MDELKEKLISFEIEMLALSVSGHLFKSSVSFGCYGCSCSHLIPGSYHGLRDLVWGSLLLLFFNYSPSVPRYIFKLLSLYIGF